MVEFSLTWFSVSVFIHVGSVSFSKWYTTSAVARTDGQTNAGRPQVRVTTLDVTSNEDESITIYTFKVLVTLERANSHARSRGLAHLNKSFVCRMEVHWRTRDRVSN
jgi:hypothetical protein